MKKPAESTSLKGWLEFEGKLYNLNKVLFIDFDDREHTVTLEYPNRSECLEVGGTSKKEVELNYLEFQSRICQMCGE